MRHHGLPLVLAIGLAACAAPVAPSAPGPDPAQAGPPPGTAGVVPAGGPADQGGPTGLAGPGGLVEGSGAPDPFPLPIDTVPADADEGTVDAVLDQLQGELVNTLPAEGTGELVPVELAAEPDPDPGSALRLLAARPPRLEPRGLGAMSPAKLRAALLADPRAIAGMAIAGERAIPPDEEGPEATYRLQALPARIDLRSAMPAIRDQQSRGTCVYFATAGVLDWSAASKATLPIKRAAPQQMYWLYQTTVVKQLFPVELWTDGGASPFYFYRVLRKEGSASNPVSPPETGYVAEAECLYDGFLPPDSPGADPGAMARKHLRQPLYDRIAAGNRITTQGADMVAVVNDSVAIRTVLAARRPVTLALPINWADWTIRAPGWKIGELEAGDPVAGYHLVAIVGYEDDPTAPGGGWYLLRNSWSAGWADGGHARISYRHVQRWGSELYAATAYDKPFSTSFTLSPPVNPTPRPSPAPSATPTPQPTPKPSPSVSPSPGPVPEPTPDRFYWKIVRRVTQNGDAYWVNWRAYPAVISPEWGFGVFGGPPITTWKPAGKGGAKEGFFPLDEARLTVKDGTKYRIQVRGKNAAGVWRYSRPIPFNGGAFPVRRSPSPSPAAATPAPAALAPLGGENPDFTLTIARLDGRLAATYAHRSAEVREPAWGWVEVASAAARDPITTWVPVTGGTREAGRGTFPLPAHMGQDGKRYRLQVRGWDARGVLHQSSTLLVEPGAR